MPRATEIMRSSLLRAAAALAVTVPAAPAICQTSEAATQAVFLEDFRLSGPPALALLGASAASVSRPNTPRELIVSLVSGAGSEGIVPDGYALETAPYWLMRHRTLGLREYYRAPLAKRLLYFTAISVATSRVKPSADSERHDAHASLALRTLLANGRPSAKLVRTEGELRAEQLEYITAFRKWQAAESRASGVESRRRRLAQQENLLSTLVTRVLVAPDPSLRDSTLRTLARRDTMRAQVVAGEAAAAEAASIAATLDRTEEKLERIARRFSIEELEPDGFILELASGGRARFIGGQWGEQEVDGIGIWITPMYRVGNRGLELTGVIRYLSNVADHDGRDVTDVGARAGVDIGKGSIAAEHVWRSLSGDQRLAIAAGGNGTRSRDESTRWAVLFDYPVTGKLWAAASFGSDYRRPDGDRPVIATIGLNLGFGAIELLPSRR